MGCGASELLDHTTNSGSENTDAEGRSLHVPDRIRRASVDLSEDITDGSVETLTGHFDRVLSMICIGSRLLSSSQDRTIFEWDLGADPHHCHNVYRGHKGPVMCVMQYGSYFIAGGADMIVSAWNQKNCTGICTMDGSQMVYSLCKGFKEHQVFAGCSDGTIQEIDMDRKWTEGQPVKAHTGSVHALLQSPDKKKLISASKDGYIKEFEVGKKLKEVNKVLAHEPGVSCMVLHQQDPFKQEYILITGGYGAKVKCWSYPGLKELCCMEGHTGTVYDVAVTPGNEVVSCSADGTVKRWSIDGQLLGMLVGHTSTVHCVAVSPQNKKLYTGSADNSIKSWNLDDQGKVVTEVHDPSKSLDMSANRRTSIFSELDVTGEAMAAIVRKDLKELSPEELQMWLSMIGLGEVGDNFAGAQGADLHGLREDDIVQKFKLPKPIATKLKEDLDTFTGKKEVRKSKIMQVPQQRQFAE